MTEKAKQEGHKHDTSARAKHQPKVAQKVRSVIEDHEKKKMAEEIKGLKEKTHEMHDKYLRLAAEFDNYRKRTVKEKAEMIRTASEDLIIKILPFVDDIERGLSAVNESRDQDALKQGMNLIYNRFSDFLQQNGVKEIEALNNDFNVDLHEAVTKIPAGSDEQKGKVVDVIQKGYLLYDKVIRYPKVVVGE
jgi:molecular chaperone GrpE